MKKRKDNRIHIKSKIWLQSGNYTMLGEGRTKLLKEIDKKGSLSKAAKSLNISYQKAWNLVDAINKSAKKEVINTKIGGVKGGGSSLTPHGRSLVNKFDNLIIEVHNYLMKKEKEFKDT